MLTKTLYMQRLCICLLNADCQLNLCYVQQCTSLSASWPAAKPDVSYQSLTAFMQGLPSSHKAMPMALCQIVAHEVNLENIRRKDKVGF